MENRPQQPADNLAAPHCDSEVNGPKKLSKRRKYEGKYVEQPHSVWVPRDFREAAINRSVEEFSLLFILAAGSFSDMFTTYSHALSGCPRQRA